MRNTKYSAPLASSDDVCLCQINNREIVCQGKSEREWCWLQESLEFDYQIFATSQPKSASNAKYVTNSKGFRAATGTCHVNPWSLCPRVMSAASRACHRLSVLHTFQGGMKISNTSATANLPKPTEELMASTPLQLESCTSSIPKALCCGLVSRWCNWLRLKASPRVPTYLNMGMTAARMGLQAIC